MVLRMWVALALMTGLIGAAIMMGSPLLAFINLPSVLLVVGGLVAGLIWSYPMSEFGLVLQEQLTQPELSEERALAGHAFFSRAADLAIASGLVGTLIGLVQMLQNLEDPNAIGPAMAVALLTLFYGVVLGELIFRSAATDCLTRAGLITDVRSRRGFVTVYAALAMLMVLMLTFFVMLVSMASF